MSQLQINPDGSEQLSYTMEGLPVRVCTDRLRYLQNYAAACHWHNDFEMLIALDGEMDYFVNSRTVHLKKGDGIFVNARRLHYGYSAEMRDCCYQFAVFHPDLLGGLEPLRGELTAFSADEQPDYWHLDATSEPIMIFHALYAAAEAGSAMQVLAYSAALIDALSRMTAAPIKEDQSQDWQLLRRMTGYIQAHYGDVITLEKIAAAGAVCRSRCCALFRDRLGASPMEYVTRYRLDKACALLRLGASITETALSCGFHGSSYFAEVFKRTYRITPREYQREARQK